MTDIVETRFWRKVERRSTSECWPWAAYCTKWGYGTLNSGGRGRMLLAHRVSWEIHHGPIPEGQIVLHGCDNPRCVNPSHLRLGTHADNMADMSKRGRHANAKGAQNPRAKLTPELVRSIRSQTDAGVSETIIAKQFGVSRSLVGQIRRRERWSDV